MANLLYWQQTQTNQLHPVFVACAGLMSRYAITDETHRFCAMFIDLHKDTDANTPIGEYDSFSKAQNACEQHALQRYGSGMYTSMQDAAEVVRDKTRATCTKLVLFASVGTKRFTIEQPINPELLTTYLLTSNADIRRRASMCLMLTVRVSLIRELADYGYVGNVQDIVPGIVTVLLSLLFDDESEIPVCTFDIEHKYLLDKSAAMLTLFANNYAELP